MTTIMEPIRSPPLNVPAATTEDNKTENETTRAQEKQNSISDISSTTVEPPHSVFSETEKKLIILTISFVGLLSPMSASIYLPALDTLAKDMHVSKSMINLTVTTYMIFQGLAPALFGNFSDIHGRRPAYIICIIIFVAANIGLALQNNYAALLVLRCMQSSGSSATVALGNAVVADVSTRAERGKWIAYASMGMFLGPCLGPIIGGLLDTYLGWRAIFWFLAIFGAVMGVVTLLFIPETCRAVVGNGSVPPQRWNRTLPACLRQRRLRNSNLEKVEVNTVQKATRRPSPIASLLICFEKEAGLVVVFGALLYAGFYLVMVTLTSQLQEKYGFGTLQVGLCFLPMGVGCIFSRFTLGFLLDRNYKRHTQKITDPETGKQVGVHSDDVPIEKIRLQIGIPATYVSAVIIVAYGWVMQFNTPLVAPLVVLFFVGNSATGAWNIISTLVMDINLDRPATAVAANNLTRCLLGAAFTAFASALINAIGIGWTATFVALLWTVSSSCLWAVYFWGAKWRQEKKEKSEKHDRKNDGAETK